MSERQITGRHVLFGTVGAFSVIIAVNVFMAVQAVETFPGLEARNGFVASQNFNAELAAQRALGWTTALAYADGVLRLSITGRDGKPAWPAELEATLARPTTTREDRSVIFERSGNELVAPMEIAPGNWNLWLKAVAADGTHFRQRLVLHVRG
ncbi:MAG: nitrogen fixation protein FixH [Alphaproteobacteria bacterium]|nr:MAG: nitrogen fixation protein FixH [Alphaproteobacteria bacterium]